MRKPKHQRRSFIPQARIRRIRWEEAVAHSIGKRSGKPYRVIHLTCHCGSVECLGAAIPWCNSTVLHKVPGR